MKPDGNFAEIGAKKRSGSTEARFFHFLYVTVTTNPSTLLPEIL